MALLDHKRQKETSKGQILTKNGYKIWNFRLELSFTSGAGPVSHFIRANALINFVKIVKEYLVASV